MQCRCRPLAALGWLALLAGCDDFDVEANRVCERLASLGAEHRERELEKIPAGPAREQARTASDSVGESSGVECPASMRARREQLGAGAWKAYVRCIEAAKTSEHAGRCDAP
jgi:hypothetical protein